MPHIRVSFYRKKILLEQHSGRKILLHEKFQLILSKSLSKVLSGHACKKKRLATLLHELIKEISSAVVYENLTLDFKFFKEFP
jgi:hypothetical protein